MDASEKTEQQEKPQQLTDRKANFILRLFRGDVSLFITYWLFGVVIGGIGGKLALFALERNYSELNVIPGNRKYFILGAIAILLYSLFVMVAIWRSASKYQGDKVWAYLAKIIVVGNLVFIGYSFWQQSDSKVAVQEEVRMLKSSLPVTLDNGLRIDDVELNNQDITYKYTLTEVVVDEVNIERFTDVVSKALLREACKGEDQSIQDLMAEDYRINFTYRDKNMAEVKTFTLTKDDCE